VLSTMRRVLSVKSTPNGNVCSLTNPFPASSTSRIDRRRRQLAFLGCQMLEEDCGYLDLPPYSSHAEDLVGIREGAIHAPPPAVQGVGFCEPNSLPSYRELGRAGGEGSVAASLAPRFGSSTRELTATVGCGTAALILFFVGLASMFARNMRCANHPSR